jgi:hypothetical protein
MLHHRRRQRHLIEYHQDYLEVDLLAEYFLLLLVLKVFRLLHLNHHQQKDLFAVFRLLHHLLKLMKNLKLFLNLHHKELHQNKILLHHHLLLLDMVLLHKLQMMCKYEVHLLLHLQHHFLMLHLLHLLLLNILLLVFQVAWLNLQMMF